MNLYHQIMPQMQGLLSHYMNQNPMQNPLFGAQMAQGTRQAAMQGLSPISNIMQSVGSGGWGGSVQPFQQGLLQSASLPGLLGRQGAFQNAYGNAANSQLQAAGMGATFNPFQTGGTNTQSQGGLGSWLPQLIGMGLQAGTMFL